MGCGIKEEPPIGLLFADDIVLCSTRREHVERKLEEWRRSTVDQVTLLTQNIEDSFQQNEKAGLVFLDLPAAHDNVWHRGREYCRLGKRLHTWSAVNIKTLRSIYRDRQ